MPRVLAMGGDVASFTGGAASFEVEASTIGALIRELERRYPGLGEYVERKMAVAVNGEIFQDADAQPLETTAEVCLIPRIGGG
jgi:molybdopterin converting factor small subunit